MKRIRRYLTTSVISFFAKVWAMRPEPVRNGQRSSPDRFFRLIAVVNNSGMTRLVVTDPSVAGRPPKSVITYRLADNNRFCGSISTGTDHFDRIGAERCDLIVQPRHAPHVLAAILRNHQFDFFR